MANLARVPRTLDNLRTTYLLAFDDEYYNVPVENVLLYPKFTNSESQETVLRVLNSRDPLDWSRFLTCGRVMHIRGQEGSAVYTTFAVTDASDFAYQRILHLVPSEVASYCFPMLKEWALCAHRVPINARQQARVAVYDWRRDTDLPNDTVIDPVANGWPRADLSPASQAALSDAGRVQPLVPDPMAEYDQFLEQRAQPPPPPMPLGVREIRAWEYDPWRDPPPMLLRRPPPPAYSGRTDDLRKLSDFLFECKDVVPEGAYLEASDALQRLWDNVI